MSLEVSAGLLKGSRPNETEIAVAWHDRQPRKRMADGIRTVTVELLRSEAISKSFSALNDLGAHYISVEGV